MSSPSWISWLRCPSHPLLPLPLTSMGWRKKLSKCGWPIPRLVKGSTKCTQSMTAPARISPGKEEYKLVWLHVPLVDRPLQDHLTVRQGLTPDFLWSSRVSRPWAVSSMNLAGWDPLSCFSSYPVSGTHAGGAQPFPIALESGQHHKSKPDKLLSASLLFATPWGVNCQTAPCPPCSDDSGLWSWVPHTLFLLLLLTSIRCQQWWCQWWWTDHLERLLSLSIQELSDRKLFTLV